MKRVILRTNSFIRAARRTLKKQPLIAENLSSTLELLSKDAFHPLLRTHKLKGDLEGSWACSVSFELRLIFRFVEYKGTEAILLETIGTHEEVY